MRRRTLVATIGTTAAGVAGCLSAAPNDGFEPIDATNGSGPGRVVDHFDGGPVRPECDAEPETVEVRSGDETREARTAETIPYPEPPDAFDRGTLLEYLESFEHAYVTHDVVCDRRNTVLSVGFGVRDRETLARHDDVQVVVLRRTGGAVSGVDGDGQLWMADLAVEEVVFAVDDSGVARAEADGPPGPEADDVESRVPDPLEDGELVAVLE